MKRLLTVGLLVGWMITSLCLASTGCGLSAVVTTGDPGSVTSPGMTIPPLWLSEDGAEDPNEPGDPNEPNEPVIEGVE